MDLELFTARQSFIYLYPVLFATLITMGLAKFAWRQTQVVGARSMAPLMLDVSFLALTTGLLFISPTEETALFWYKARYLFLSFLPPFFLLFIINYTGHARYQTKRRIATLFIIPSIIQVIIWEDFSLFITKARFIIDGPLYLMASDSFGPMFYLHLTYSQILIFIGIAIILYTAFRGTKTYQMRAIVFLIGTIPPIVLSIFLVPYKDVTYSNYTPMVYLFVSLFLWWALFQYRLLDLLPVAQKTIIDTMRDGLLIVDEENKIILVNPAAENILGICSKVVIGEKVNTALARTPQVAHFIFNVSDGFQNIEIRKESVIHYFDLRITPIIDQNKIAGRIAAFHDETETINTMDLMEIQLQEIRSLQSELKELSIRDPLTKLLNRRMLNEILPREISRSEREEESFIVMAIDIDHFKKVNDHFGHPAGDKVLQDLAAFFLKNQRGEDSCFRMGGEEFLIILPGMDTETGYKRAEELRQKCESMITNFNGKQIQITISIGVSVYPDHGTTEADILHTADKALYCSKEKGRNQVTLWDSVEISQD